MSTFEITQSILEDNPPLGDWSILTAMRGSVAHGLWESNSQPNSIDDLDAISICVPPKDHYLGLSQMGKQGTIEIMSDPWDVVMYESRKAIKLLAKGNPNIISILWLCSEDYLWVEEAGRLLIESRDLFSTLAFYHSLVAYSRDQLIKMKRGNFEGYMGAKRKALFETFGFDTKNACHLIRLLRMGIEFFESGQLNVNRREIDAEELLEIKHGEWSLDRVTQEAERLFLLAPEIVASSSLPECPSLVLVNKLAVQVAQIALEARGEL